MVNSATLLMESRIHGDMYVRFGGRYGETYHRKVAKRSMPSLLTCIHSETKERIKYDDYKQLSEEERAKYNVYPKLQTYNVFNVEGQTNLKEARPELFKKLQEQNEVSHPVQQEGEMFFFPCH